MLETLDYTIRIGSTPTFLYFDLQISASTPAMRKRYVFVLRGDHDVSVFENLRPWKAFSKASVFVGQSIRFFHRISVDNRRKRI